MRESLFLLPDVGEGLTEAEIVSWRVAPGDTISINQVIVEIETAKSLVELPSPYEGVVREILVGEGDTVEVGTPIIRVFGDDGEESELAEVVAEIAATVLHEPEPEPEQEAGAGAVLVGYGSKGHVTSRRRSRLVPPVGGSADDGPAAP